MGDEFVCYLELEFPDETAAEEAIEGLQEHEGVSFLFSDAKRNGSRLTVQIPLDSDYVAERVESDILDGFRAPVVDLGGKIDINCGVYFR